MRGRGLKRGLAIVALLGAASPAFAGTLYRCDTADGARSYTSKRIPGATCKVISYGSKASRPAPAAGSATAPNKVSGSPVSANIPADAPAPTALPVPPAPMAPAPPPYRAPRLVQGQVYSYIQDGVRHYTSKPPRGVAGATALRTIKYSFMETCYACAARPGVNFNTLRLNTDAYAAEIMAAAKLHGVDPAIVRAIIHAESAYNPNALSRVGAQGLMQLMPATARRFGVGNAFDASQNIAGGVQYLAWLLKRFNGDLSLAAAGYNAGEGAVDKYRGVPPYAETRRYVERVSVLADRYRGALASTALGTK
ncbi:lytic transglycosylase domain-containing protein [Lysobacter sp. KIS68-7]|uniref:lytic transglycosylase domain-containing protein n=1 Tax=Lysobacter sp. KIS68-7 TaxID=2904252 RepID=UPI001E493FA2|nr:lytic transglycosylase domain-containing protein [Lysobacter sp. KIS68-7]UHQ19628.1 lytic transglycosylase domain-containing protein [Lysobacter sp. KIS68-7]